jgi:hypothetical protein
MGELVIAVAISSQTCNMTDALPAPLDSDYPDSLNPLDPRLVTTNGASKGDNKRKLNKQANGEEVAPDEKPNDEPTRRKPNLWKCRCCRDDRKKASQ